MNAEAEILEDYGLDDFVQVCKTINKLTISIFSINNREFLFYSKTVNDMFGYSPDLLKIGGWDMW